MMMSARNRTAQVNNVTIKLSDIKTTIALISSFYTQLNTRISERLLYVVD